MSPRLKYSYQFGQETVEAFVEKYARGTYFCAQMLGIDYDALCARLIYQVRCDIQLKWEASKRLIKQCERENFRDYKHQSVENRRKYMKIALSCCVDEELDKNIAEKALKAQTLLPIIKEDTEILGGKA